MEPTEPVVTRHTATYRFSIKEFLAALGISVDHNGQKITELTLGKLGKYALMSMTTTDIPHLDEGMQHD